MNVLGLISQLIGIETLRLTDTSRSDKFFDRIYYTSHQIN